MKGTSSIFVFLICSLIHSCTGEETITIQLERNSGQVTAQDTSDKIEKNLKRSQRKYFSFDNKTHHHHKHRREWKKGDWFVTDVLGESIYSKTIQPYLKDIETVFQDFAPKAASPFPNDGE